MIDAARRNLDERQVDAVVIPTTVRFPHGFDDVDTTEFKGHFEHEVGAVLQREFGPGISVAVTTIRAGSVLVDCEVRANGDGAACAAWAALHHLQA